MQRKKLSGLLTTALGLLLVGSSITPVAAQNRTAQSAKKSKAAESCDGALDIVPSKPMTFVRKRRPPAPAQAKPADQKVK